MLVIAMVLVLSTVGLRLLERAAHVSGIAAPQPAVAAVLVTAALLELGALLAVRLVVVPDPAAPFGAGLGPQALAAGYSALVQPFLGIAVALALLAVLARSHRTQLGRTRAGWPLIDGMHRLVSSAVRPGDGTLGRGWLVGVPLVLLLVALSLLPRFAGEPTGSAWLTAWGVATPEYGKVLLLIGLAWVAARDSHSYEEFDSRRLYALVTQPGTVRSRRRTALAVFLATRYAVYPLALFLIVVVASGVRRDFGTLVATVAGTVGVTVAATGHNVRRSVFITGPRRYLTRFLAAYRLFFRLGAVIPLAVGCAFLFTDYTSERGRVWTDPWTYRWDAGCAPAAPGTPTPKAPDGTVTCLRSLAADTESERSQVARALSAIADGGVWGNGLQDTMAGAVPAGSTDFITAVMWNKLGGIVVLATVVLMVLLAAALVRTVRPPGASLASPSPASLLGWGLATTIVGQYLFVFAATTNFVPHSGVPVPFLSRGGQSTLALALGVILVLSLGVAGASSAPDRPAWAPGPVPRRLAGWWRIALPVAPFTAIALVITLVPYFAPLPKTLLPTVYDAKRAPCLGRPDGPSGLLAAAPDPRLCSTDQIAFERTRIQISFGGRAGLVQHRSEGVWEVVGSGALGGLTVEDLAGLVQVGRGHLGVLERSYPAVVSGSAGTDLKRRLSLPSPERVDGGLDLTIDPAWQHELAHAMRSDDGHGTGPLAGGLVVIDASTGRVLAAVSTPPEPVVATSSPVVSEAEAQAFAQAHGEYGRIDPDGHLDDSTVDESCPRRGAAAARQRDCWQWSYQATAPSGERDRELRRYVAGDPGVELPAPQQNRALGKWYGLGSTFKVIIAAAYLNQPGTRASDLIDAPEIVWLSPATTVHNAGGGLCRGTVDGSISLTRALAVSCNTAFVRLAQRLGWESIAEQAEKFGLTVGSCLEADTWTVNALKGAVSSCVPATTDGVAVGNNALGGQDVQGTPLAMASVLATVANRGRAIQPSLVATATPPDTGRTIHPPAGKTRVALSPQAAAELERALSQTAVDGTAAALRDAGTQLWVKTGTHEVVPAGTALPRSQFVRDISWMAGFLETSIGRVAFAVAVETRDEVAGAQRVSYLVRQLCRTARGER